MIVRYLVWAFLGLAFTASDPFYGGDILTPQGPSSDIRELSWMSQESAKTFLNDEDNRVSPLFKVKPYYWPNVYFWFLVYSNFTSNQIIIHDRNDLRIIYRVLDFSNVISQKLHPNSVFVLQQKMSQDKLQSIRDDLAFLARNPFSREPQARAILLLLQEAQITIPVGEKSRRDFFHKLSQNVRTQTGQNNFIREGILRSQPYRDFLEKHFLRRSLPKELLAIPFLESSFHPSAESRVSALGAWQFMPLIASYYLPPRQPHIDYRSSVGVASVGAAFLLSENVKILKSWDLAVTAYNSGPTHLLRAKRKLGPQADLEAIIKLGENDHFGFASKNFYSEFLALVHALAYREELYDDLHHDQESDDPLEFYILKCQTDLRKFLDSTERSHLEHLNHHLKNSARVFSKGFILNSKLPLPSTRFLKVEESHLSRFKPKDWGKLLRNQSCSTR